MNPTEELLRQTLHHHAQDAPLVQTYQPIKSKGRHLMARWMVPVAAAAVTAAVVGGIAWSDRQESITGAEPTASDVLDRVHGLSGPVVAETLGLEGEPDTKADVSCQYWVVADQNGVRYCLDSVSDDQAVQMVVGWQIGGRTVTASSLEYARALIALYAAQETTQDDHPSIRDLRERVAELKDIVQREARAQEDSGTGLPDIRGLTGEDVGVALRLQPMQTADQPGCQAFAEYQNGIGFCYEKLTWPDRPASYILGKQITGHAPTDPEADYLAAVLELNAMNDGRIEYDAGREAELTALITALRTQLETRRTGD